MLERVCTEGRKQVSDIVATKYYIGSSAGHSADGTEDEGTISTCALSVSLTVEIAKVEYQ